MKSKPNTASALKPEAERGLAAEHRTALGWPLIYVLLGASIGTAVIGLLTLLGWGLGLPSLASFGADLIPMAPSTAVLFLLYGVAVSLRVRTPPSARAFQFSLAAGCFGMLVALVLFVLGYRDIAWSGEHLGLNITGTFQGARIGYMSPVTAFIFLCVGMSFLGSLSRSAIRPWRAALALGSTIVVLGTGCVFLLAYLYGAPLLYGGTFIPPALNTLLALTLLGLALLILIGRIAGWLGGARATDSRTGFAFLLIFLILAIGIIAVGGINYRHHAQRFRTEVETQLSAIADLKVGELVQWRKERMADAGILFRNDAFSTLVRRFLEKPGDADAQHELQAWLDKYHGQPHYDQVCLLDTQNVIRLSAPVITEPVAALVSRQATASLRLGQIAIQDFYRDERNQRVYLAVLVPIIDKPGTNHPLGVLLLRIDPAAYLFPFIKRWPTPSRTAETLLVRREENVAVFLNELRFQTKTALNLRAPLDRIAMPAVQAALGREGVMEGMDYRGAPVVAAIRTIPDSPWALAARMDTAEIYAPVRERLWQMIVLIAVLIFGTGAAVVLVWRRQRVRFNRDSVAAGEVLRASELRYRRLFESAKDGILILDAETGMVVDVNPFLIQLLGFPREACLGKHIWELGFIKDIVANQGSFAELQQKQYVRYEDKPLQTADGRLVDVEFVSNVYLVNEQKVIQCNIRDITARKQVEETLQASKRLAQATLDALSAHIAVLDEAGVIIAVNRAWRAFAEANPPVTSNVNEGANYLTVCDTARGPDSETAAVAAAGIRAVIRGAKSAFEMEYPCHSPDIKRWFICRVSRVHGAGAARATVAHENITTRMQAEEAQRVQMQELQRWHAVTLGREGRVIELKREVNACLAHAGEPPRYASVNSEPSSVTGH